MKSVLALLALVAVVAAQNAQFSFNGQQGGRLPCQFACSTAAMFTTSIDGTIVNARCTDPQANAADRCPGCCQSVALAAGFSTDVASGFPSSDGSSCVCCISAC